MRSSSQSKLIDLTRGILRDYIDFDDNAEGFIEVLILFLTLIQQKYTPERLPHWIVMINVQNSVQCILSRCVVNKQKNEECGSRSFRDEEIREPPN